MLSEEPSFVRG